MSSTGPSRDTCTFHPLSVCFCSLFLFPFCLLAEESATLKVKLPGTDGSLCLLSVHAQYVSNIFLLCLFVHVDVSEVKILLSCEKKLYVTSSPNK